MSSTKAVIVVHPGSETRVLLRSILQARGLTVMTDHSCRHLLEDRSDLDPGILLLGRAALGDEGLDALSQLRRKWPEAESVFLPEALGPVSIPALLLHLHRLLGMRTTRELLAV